MLAKLKQRRSWHHGWRCLFVLPTMTVINLAAALAIVLRDYHYGRERSQYLVLPAALQFLQRGCNRF